MKTKPKKKPKKKPTVAQIWDELLQRRLVGELLSNCAFNLAQGNANSDNDRKVLDDCRKRWDSINAV